MSGLTTEGTDMSDMFFSGVRIYVDASLPPDRIIMGQGLPVLDDAHFAVAEADQEIDALIGKVARQTTGQPILHVSRSKRADHRSSSINSWWTVGL